MTNECKQHSAMSSRHSLHTNSSTIKRNSPLSNCSTTTSTSSLSYSSPSSQPSSPSSISSSNRTSQMALALLLLLISSQIVTSAPAYEDLNLRDLYDILIRHGNQNALGLIDNPTPFVHQMERKGGRSPTLRLRFGRRSDPLWSNGKIPSTIDNNGGIGNDDQEKVPYK